MTDLSTPESEWVNEVRKSILSGFFQTGDGAWRPALDIIETDDAYRVEVAIPGVQKEDIDIEIRDDVFTISGERKETEKNEQEGYHIREIPYGKFNRSLRLPVPVDPDDVSAKLKNGIIEIILPKIERTKSRRIKIEEEE
jgi:HSP20 family protein